MKKVFVALVLSILMTILVVTPAMAGAAQAPLYPVTGGNSDYVLASQPAQGKVIINAPKGSTTFNFTVIAKGLDPDHFYTVWVRNLGTSYTGDFFNQYAPLGYFLLGYFTTDEDGEGNFHLNINKADLGAGTYNIQVAINDVAEIFPLAIGSTVLATPKYTIVNVGK